MIYYNKNHWRAFTMWLEKEDNQKEIKEWQDHLRKIYPQIHTNPDWLLDKYGHKYRGYGK